MAKKTYAQRTIGSQPHWWREDRRGNAHVLRLHDVSGTAARFA
ncbi:MAG: hypothetical protein ACLR8L_16220 [Oscillospiraceae bacterium]